MPSLQTFVRRTPARLLKEYFEYAQINLPTSINWNGTDAEVNKSVIEAIGELDEASRTKIFKDSERVSAMADETGRVAIYSVAQDKDQLKTLESDHARAVWLIINNQKLLRNAEEVRNTDESRRGRNWDGYVCEKGINLDNSENAIAELAEAMKQHFNSKNVYIDMFDRVRPTFDGVDCEILQLTVYRDGDPEDMLSFDSGGELVSRSYRPVFEIAMTYESSSGVLEIVARNRTMRKEMAKLFITKLLNTDFDSRKVEVRRYDLDVLLKPHQFPVDLEDGIESVEVRQLRLMPIGSEGERVTLECLMKAKRTIWDLANEKLGQDALSRGWRATQAKLVIKFCRKDGESRGKTLTLIITMPHGCNLKERTDNEQLIGEKYLRRWRILTDDPILFED